MNVAICAYGAGNVRSVQLAFERLGATAEIAEERRAPCATPTSRSCRASARRRPRWPGCAARGLDDALRERAAAGRPILGICLGLQLALDESEEDGGVAGLGLAPGRAVRLRDGRVPRIGWAPLEPGGETFWFAHSYAAETPAATATSEGLAAIVEHELVHRRAVPSREERRGGSALPDAMPLPRLIPCLDVAGGRVVKGVRFEELRDVGDPVELGAAYSDAGADELVFLDIVGDGRVARRGASRSPARVAEQVTIPFTFGGGIRSVEDACAVLEAGADKVSVNSAALARPELIEEIAGVAREPGRRRRDRHRERPRALARGDARRRARHRRVGARVRGARRGRAARDVDRPRRHAQRLRPRAARAPARRRVAAGDRVGRRGQRCARRRRARRRRRSAARVDPARAALRGSSRCGKSCATSASRFAMQPDLRAAIVQDARRRPRPDARVDGRRGAPPDAGDGRGLVLEPLAASGSGRRARRRATCSPSRSCATTATATRCSLRVVPRGPACHTGSTSCFAPALWRTVVERVRDRPEGSYVASLADAGVERAAQKLGEEAVEAAIAATANDGRLVSEAADVLFHLYVLLAVAGVDVAEVEDELARRSAWQLAHDMGRGLVPFAPCVSRRAARRTRSRRTGTRPRRSSARGRPRGTRRPPARGSGA